MWLSSFLTLLSILGGIAIAHFDLRQLSDSESAIANLEDVLKSEEEIREFCYRHYECQRRDCNGGSTINSTSKDYNNCVEIRDDGYTTSGIYEIQIGMGMEWKKIKVYCDMETEGGGWLVIQRRGEFHEEHINFVKQGSEGHNKEFGNLSSEFWLGNENIHLLTTEDEVALRVDMEDIQGNTIYAEYLLFQVKSHENLYTLKIGNYSGNAGDGMSLQNENTFNYTYYWFNGTMYAGWWWGHRKRNIPFSFLNGDYVTGDGFPTSIWYINIAKFTYINLKRTEMKIKPVRYLSKDNVGTAMDKNDATETAFTETTMNEAREYTREDELEDS